MFGSWHYCTDAFSARSPCNLGSQAVVAISVLREVSKDTMLARYHFCSWHEKIWERLGVLGHCHPQGSPWTLLATLAYHATGFPVLFRCHFYLGLSVSAGPRNKSRRSSSLSSCYLGFSVSAGPRDESRRSSSLPADAGCCVGITASCHEDVGDVRGDELEELVDGPGSTNGT